MNRKSQIYFSLVLAIISITLSECHPAGSQSDEVEVELAESSKPVKGDGNRLKQEDVDEDEATTKPYAFGQQVAQIIKGSLTGDLGSILQGSFNLVPNPETQDRVNGAWATIAGIPQTPAPSVNTAAPVTTRSVSTTTEPEPEETTKEESTTEEEIREKSTTPSNEDDDDDDAEEADKENEDLDKSVYSRSKVLRVI